MGGHRRRCLQTDFIYMFACGGRMNCDVCFMHTRQISVENARQHRRKRDETVSPSCGNASVDVACFLPLVPPSYYYENIVEKIKAIFHILWIYLKLSYANVGCSGAAAMHRLRFDTFILCAPTMSGGVEYDTSFACVKSSIWMSPSIVALTWR